MSAGSRQKEPIVKPSLALLAVVALSTAAITSLARLSPAPASSATPAAKTPPRVVVQYAHVKSLRRAGGRFLMRVDPALWLGGVTAYHAAVEDKAIAPGEAVPNDYYIRDPDHRLLTYRVPSNAHVTVLTRTGSGPIPTTTISVAELAQIVRGKNPKRRRLLEPKAGYWLRVSLDSVLSLDQQYQP
jgi:hypothetical protein